MKHNREQTITLEFEMGAGHGRGGCDMIYMSTVLIKGELVYSTCVLLVYTNTLTSLRDIKEIKISTILR